MLKNFYLIMAILGTLIPWAFFANFFATEGLNLPLFITSLFSNGAAGGFSADVLISIVVFWVWAYTDAQKKSSAVVVDLSGRFHSRPLPRPSPLPLFEDREVDTDGTDFTDREDVFAANYANLHEFFADWRKLAQLAADSFFPTSVNSVPSVSKNSSGEQHENNRPTRRHELGKYRTVLPLDQPGHQRTARRPAFRQDRHGQR